MNSAFLFWQKKPILGGHHNSPTNAKRYMAQLDGLRAFAVGAVLIHHFSALADIGRINLAALGVWLFFVLSGFLITGILLRSRDQINSRGYQASFLLRQFYIRRFLRIFPLYYFVLSIAAMLDLGEVRDTILWHLGYMSNYLFATQGYWGSVTAHFWSLSVEEQFYVFWPWVIFLVPQRLLLKVILATIALAPIFRAVGYYSEYNGIALYVVAPVCFDALGLGALLAYCSHHGVEKPALKKRLRQWCSWLSVPGLILLFLFRYLENHEPPLSVVENVWFVEPVLWALLFVLLVDRASSGFKGIIGKILELKSLGFIGKISYGIYVYHLFMPSLVPAILSQSKIDFFLLPGWIRLSILTAVTVGVSALSWQFLEYPFNSLKNYFVYADDDSSGQPKIVELSQLFEVEQ